MIKLRFASVILSDTAAAKESRVKLTTFGFTCALTSDVAWLKDIAAFAKAPEGVRDQSFLFSLTTDTFVLP